jgi:methanogenic corrinoid protein MtbC1
MTIGYDSVMSDFAGTPPSSTPSSPEQLLRAIDESVQSLDRRAAVTVALRAVAENRITLADLYAQVLSPYLTSIGTSWRHGSERVWQEHFASHTVRTIVEALYPAVLAEAAKAAKRPDCVLLACPPREQHELGLRMLADRFEMAGYRAVFLGADTPVEEIVAAARSVRATMVALSVSTVFERVELHEFVDAIKRALPGVRILLGGAAFAREHASWPAEELLDPAELGLPGAKSGR